MHLGALSDGRANAPHHDPTGSNIQLPQYQRLTAKGWILARVQTTGRLVRIQPYWETGERILP
jgi:hypothetical protein